jgi:hypothetical protein
MFWHVRFARVAVVAVMVAVLATLSAAPLSAQGFYYKEIRKDDRIYVFNNAKSADAFEKTGEMGVGITRLGAGPNGETVIGDNERALQLFFFKHGISEPVPDPPAPPPPAPAWKISGYMFGDYYSFVENNSSKFEGQHGFWLRRAYFTYDHNLSPKFTTRLRFEVNSNGKLAGGSLTPYVKDAYLRWTFYGRQQLTLGIQPTLSFDFVESVWGLRHIEKTPLDLYRWDGSRDFGVTMAGPMNEANTLKYAVQFGNESGNNSETDKYKAVRAAARYEANPGFSLEGVFAMFDRDKDADRVTGQVFAGYRAKRARVGAQYSVQERKAAAGSTAGDVTLNIYSGFGVVDLKPNKASLFVRVDRYDDACPDCAGLDYLPMSGVAPFTMVMGGFEYYLLPSVRLSPNFQYVTYSTPESSKIAKPESELVLRATFYWVW